MAGAGHRENTGRLGALSAALMLVLAATGCAGAPEAQEAQGREGRAEVTDAGVTIRVSDTAAEPPVMSAAGAYLAGRHAQQLGESGEAADFLKTILTADPRNGGLMERTAVLLMIDGRHDEALTYARQLLDGGADSQMSRLLVASSHLRDGRIDEANETIASLGASAFGSLLRPLLAAWARVGVNDFDGAMAAMEPLSREQRHARLYALHAAMIADALDRPDAALAQYEKAITDPGRATLRAVLAYGSRLERSGRAQEAAALYDGFRDARQGQSLLPDGLLTTGGPYAARPLVADAREGAAEAMLTIAGAVQQHDLRDISLILARLALWLREDLNFARLIVAEVLEDEGRPAAALAMLEEIGPDTPYHWSSKLARARLLYDLDRREDAFALLRSAADVKPDTISALVQLGNLLRVSERWTDAIDVYDNVMARPGPHPWTLHYHRGIALERAGLWDRAEADFLRALELKPDAALVLNYLGYSWADQGKNLDRALGMIEQAVRLRPNDGYIADSLGWVLYRLGKYERATEELERAVEIRPEDPVINDHLGDAYWRVGREVEARFQWSRALALDPEPELVETIKEKLARGLGGGPSRTFGDSR